MYLSYYQKDIVLSSHQKYSLIKLYQEYRQKRGWDKSKVTLPSHLDNPSELEHILYTLSSQKIKGTEIPTWITDFAGNDNQTKEFPLAKTFREKMKTFLIHYGQSELHKTIQPLLDNLDKGYNVPSFEVEKKIQEARIKAIEWALEHSTALDCYITATLFPDVTLEEKMVFRDKLSSLTHRWEGETGDEVETLNNQIAELKKIAQENLKIKDEDIGGIVDTMSERMGAERRFFVRLKDDESSNQEKIFRFAFNDPNNPATIEIKEGGTLDIYGMGGNEDSDYNGDLYDYLNANISLDGEDKEVVKLLMPKKNAIIENVLSKQGGNSYKFNEIKSLQVETLGYTNDIIISVKSNKGSEMGVAFGYGSVADIIGRVTTEKIRKVIDEQKLDIKMKNENGYYRNRPFNTIKEVWFKGGEAGGKVDLRLKDLNELHEHIERMYRTKSVPKAHSGYDKTWVEIKLSNADGEEFTISPRIDISETDGDFNPATSTVKGYLQKEYSRDTERKLVNGLEVYVDLRDRIDFIRADKLITEMEEWLKEEYPDYDTKSKHEKEMLIIDKLYETRDSGGHNSEFCGALLIGDRYTTDEIKEEAERMVVAEAHSKNETKRNESKDNAPNSPDTLKPTK